MSASYNYVPLSKVEKQLDKNDGPAICSPILFELLAGLSKEKHHEILDIMPASQGMLNLFSGFYCKLYLPGCLQELCDLKLKHYDTENKLYHAFARLIGFYKKQRSNLSVIFLWDLPNYMDESEIKALINYLSEHMDNKVQLHLYIHTRRQMPSSPCLYSVIPEGKVLIEYKSDAKVESPLYFHKSLESLLHPFKVRRSVLLSRGLQEYILEL